jgi:hypothetical protein
MAFPFVAPFDNWVVEVLKQREKNPLIGVYKNPYAVLTSGAKVIKSTPSDDPTERIKELKKILGGGVTSGIEEYNGCIISNNVNNTELSYSTQGTPVGIDLTGKIIRVDGETDRRVSTPIIESVEIDTDGANNTLKTARVNLRCFTLKQFEMFEMFFMKPGMNVLLEFGDSSILGGLVEQLSEQRDKSLGVFRNGEIKKIDYKTRVEECLLDKSNLEKFYDSFSQYFRSNITGTIDYFGRIESSLGTYDLIAGKVTDYNFSIDADLTYTVQIEITQANQISLAMPCNPKKKNSNTNTTAKEKSTEYSEKDQIIDSIILNFDLEKSKLETLINKRHPVVGKDWITDEFFNYNKVDTTQKDNIASADAYVSLRFILHILLNYIVTTTGTQEDTYKFAIPKYYTKKDDKSKRGSDEIEFIPVCSNEYMISTSDDVIFPTDRLPIMIAPPSGSINGEITIDEKNKLDGTINGYNFHYDGDLYHEEEDHADSIKNKQESSTVIGNALNIFIKYETVVRIWKQELYRIDFLNSILDTINKNSHGLFQLVYGSTSENGPASILDYKFSNTEESKIRPLKKGEMYRFKIGPRDSIVKSFSFNFELSNLVAGQTLFNSNKFVSDALTFDKDNANKKAEDIQLPPNVYKSLDMSTMSNADGWYAVNYVEYKNIQKKIEDRRNQQAQVSTAGKEQVASGVIEQPEATTEAQNLEEVIKEKSVKFITGKDEQKTLIYRDDSFILEKISDNIKKKTRKPTLSPIDVTLSIDGFSGFRCGYCFNIDGIPESYNKNGVFQITNVKHSLNNEGWITTIEAGYTTRKLD